MAISRSAFETQGKFYVYYTVRTTLHGQIDKRHISTTIYEETFESLYSSIEERFQMILMGDKGDPLISAFSTTS